MKKNVFKMFCLMTAVLMSVSLVSCDLFGGDDDDDDISIVSNPQQVVQPTPGQTGWTGDVDNGASSFVPEGTPAQNSFGGQSYCVFIASDGICQTARVCMAFANPAQAMLTYQDLLNMDDDDEEDARAYRLMSEMKTRAVSPTDLGMNIESNVIYFNLPFSGKPMSIIRQVVECWTKGSGEFYYSPLGDDEEEHHYAYDIAQLPNHPIWGNLTSDLDYWCELSSHSVYRLEGITRLEQSVVRNADNQITAFRQTLQCESHEIARQLVGTNYEPSADQETVIDGNRVTFTNFFPGIYREAPANLIESYFRQMMVYHDVYFNMPIGWVIAFEGMED